MAAIRWRKYLRFLALGVSASVCVGLAYLGLATRQAAELAGIASTFASIAATLIGFIIAALSILASLMDRTLLKNMNKTGHFDVLLGELRDAAWAFLLVLVLALVSLFLPYPLLQAGISVSAGAMACGVLVLIQAGWKFFRVIAMA
ncbi:MAG: hypothetical protein WAT23_00180 [Chromatiaceae bacterium]